MGEGRYLDHVRLYTELGANLGVSSRPHPSRTHETGYRFHLSTSKFFLLERLSSSLPYVQCWIVSDLPCRLPQEVDAAQYKDYFRPTLEDMGYQGVFAPRGRAKNMSATEGRTVDGCAIFFKKSKYVFFLDHLTSLFLPFSRFLDANQTRYRFIKEAVIDFAQVAIQRDDFLKNNDMFNRLLSRDHVAVVSLCENIKTGSRVIVANAHTCWEPAFCDVKLIQTGILIESLKGIAEWFATMPPPPPQMNGDSGDEVKFIPPKYAEGKDIPIIVSGDYNSLPGSGVYNFLAEGRVLGNHPDFMDFVYGKFTADGLRHDFGLRDAYADLDEFPITNYVPTFQGHIDYIWYNTAALSVNKVLSGVDQTYMSKYVGFPNAHFPSE